jgi:uncharacterized protein (TIGR03435 family)
MSDWMYFVGWILVHFVWQGTVVAFAAALALHVCRHQQASTRYLIACGAMVAMLLCATLTAALVEAPAASIAGAPVPVATSANGSVDVLLPIPMGATEAASPAARFQLEPLLPWIVSAWLAGVLVLLARVVAGWWRVRSLHQHALLTMRSSWQHAADRLAGRLGLARVVRIVELSGVDVPLVVGCLRPIVVLPIAALSSLNAAQVEAIIAHELAHVRRHDYIVNLMQTLAETLLFYHPAVWWLSARIRDEREHCCDDVAVAVCGDAAEYAAALTELEASRTGGLSLAAAATGGSLLNRVRRILRVEISDDSRMSPLAIGVVALAVGAALGVSLVAQAPAPAESPTFEVASVRPNTSGDNKQMVQILPGGRYNGINIPPRLLIMNSYGLQPQQLVGAPDWISSERFDIVAKAEGDLGPPVSRDGPSRLQLMIRALLEERFKLKVHREPREVPVYALVLARPDGRLGSGLTVSTVDCEALAASRRGAPPPDLPKPGERLQCGAWVGFGELTAGAQPLQELVSLLSSTVGRSVVDRTGLNGRYDITLRWTPDRVLQRTAGAAAGDPIRVNGVDIDPNGPSIFTAIQEQLGLKLESERGTVEALVIDHIERPTPD